MRFIYPLILITLFTQSISGQQITGIFPLLGNSGTGLNVTISGYNTHFTQATNTTVGFFFSGATSTVTFTSGNVPLNNLTLVSNLAIPGWVPDGLYDFGVYNEIDGFMLKPLGFHVIGPRIDSLIPNQAKAGDKLPILITGVNTYFTQATNTVVRFHFSGASGTATYPVNTSIVNNTSLEVVMEVEPTIPTGWYDVSVTNDLSGYLLKPAAFFVLNDIGVPDLFRRNEIEIYPNPFTDRLFLKSSDAREHPVTIRVYDLTGTLTEQRSLWITPGDNELNLNHLKQGVYYFVITGQDGNTQMQKVIRH